MKGGSDDEGAAESSGSVHSSKRPRTVRHVVSLNVDDDWTEPAAGHDNGAILESASVGKALVVAE